MLRWRLLLGALLIAALAGLVWADANGAFGIRDGCWLYPVAILLAVPATNEMLAMFAARGVRPSQPLLYIANPLIVASNLLPMYCGSLFDRVDQPVSVIIFPLLTFVLSVLATFIVEMFRYREAGHSTARLSASVLALSYVGLLLSFVVQLRILGTNSSPLNLSFIDHLALLPLLSTIAIVKLGDIGAYTTGRLFGRHKMTPTLSPGKTWEGAAGAMLGGVIGSTALLYYSFREHSAEGFVRWAIYGAILAIVGLLGDLAESLLKRDNGRKDSSDWMPGFGGVLDLLDSILFAAPVAYLCWLSGLVS